MAKLSNEQEQKIARLLVHFTNRTNSEILGRFDRGTRNRIRQVMSELGENEPVASVESLKDFAEFLYFEPETEIEPDESSSRLPSNQSQHTPLEFTDIVRLPDVDLDQLLQAAPVELTLDTLCCSPSSFVNRVIDRLSDEDGQLVRERLSNNTDSIDYAQMQSLHRQFCDCAESLIQQGSMHSPRGN